MARRRDRLLLGSVLVLAAVGCAYLTGPPSQQPSKDHELEFSHELHLGEDLACSDCHKGLEEGGEPGFPAPSVCADCHDEEGGEEAEPGSLPSHFFAADGTILQPSVTALDDDVRFSHAFHVGEKGLECGGCHQGIAESTGVTGELKVQKDRCLACHTENGADNAECSRCHVAISASTPPTSHRFDWQKRHGGFVRNNTSDKIADRCAMCHTEATCVGCHQDQPPSSHNAFWRHKGHTLAAATDRSRCETCHQPDLCNQCHQRTAPRSHVGSWGSPGDRHCSTCHLDGSGRRGCTLCHEGAPSHDTAPLQPASHSPGMNCRQCHGRGQPLPHRDTGVACNACHR